MPSPAQPLSSAARLLKEAQELVHDVELIVEHCGYRDLAHRLKALRDKLREELDTIRSLSEPKP